MKRIIYPKGTTVKLSYFGKETRLCIKEALREAKKHNKAFYVDSDYDDQLFYTEYPEDINNSAIATCFPNGVIKNGYVIE